MSSSTILIWSYKFLTSATLCELLRTFTMPNLRNADYHWFLWENLVIFVVGLLNNWLVKVTETFTDILNYYVLQTTANKFAVYAKMYVVKKYLKSKKKWKTNTNKKVLLREHKRHTTHRIASACYADLSPDGGGGGGIHPALGKWGYPIQSWAGGYPIQSWPGGTPSSPGQGGIPIQSWILYGVPHISRIGYPLCGPEMGYPPSRPGTGCSPLYGPGMGYPAPIQTRDGIPPPPSGPGMGYPPNPDLEGEPPSPPRVNGLKKITFPHPSDAGGNKLTLWSLLPLRFNEPII